MSNIKLLLLLLSLSTSVSAQIFKKDNELFEKIKKVKMLEISEYKLGPYFGYQTGRYGVIEFGYHGQYKRIKLRKPVTLSGTAGVNYDIFRNVVGYDLGVWGKIGRVSPTLGLSLIYRSDFEVSKTGIAPAIGFSFGPLYVQAGYQWLNKRSLDLETNTLFVGARFTLFHSRKVVMHNNPFKK